MPEIATLTECEAGFRALIAGAVELPPVDLLDGADELDGAPAPGGVPPPAGASAPPGFDEAADASAGWTSVEHPKQDANSAVPIAM